MARKRKQPKYFYRACWRHDQLRALLSSGDQPTSRSGRFFGYVGAWQKVATTANPYGSASELICATLGTFLGLPIPPFAITAGPDNEPCFSSLDFNCNQDRLPRVVPDKCVEFMARISAGVLAFDILIANEDRHDENLLVDQVSHPTEMWVFDHDQALLAGCLAKGIAKLTRFADYLGITGGDDIGGNRHVFLDELRDPSHLEEWIGRIESIPRWFIADACDCARQRLGISKEDADAACAFLAERKKRVGELIKNNRNEFKAVTQWPAGLFP